MDPIHFAIGAALGAVAHSLVTGDWRDVVCGLTRHRMREIRRVTFEDRCNGVCLACLCGKHRESVSRHCHEHEEELCHDRLWAEVPARYR